MNYKMRDIKITFKTGEQKEFDRGYLHIIDDHPGYRLSCWNLSNTDIQFKTSSECICQMECAFVPTRTDPNVNYYNDDEFLEIGEYSPEARERKRRERLPEKSSVPDSGKRRVRWNRVIVFVFAMAVGYLAWRWVWSAIL